MAVKVNIGKNNTPVVMCVVVCITIIELYALHNGINGKLLTAVIGILAMLAGLVLPTPKLLGGG